MKSLLNLPTNNLEAFDFLIASAQEAKRIYVNQESPEEFVGVMIEMHNVVDQVTNTAIEIYEATFQRPVELVMAGRAIQREAQAIVQEDGQ